MSCRRHCARSGPGRSIADNPAHGSTFIFPTGADRRRRHRRHGAGADAAADRRALHRLRVRARTEAAGRGHQPAAQRRARALRPGPGRGATRHHRHPGARMGAGGAQRQRRLFRAARPAGRLPLAAVFGAPRAAADAAVPHGVRAAGPAGRAAGPPGHRLPPGRRWRDRAAADARRQHAGSARQPAGGGGRPAFRGARADASAAAADPLGRRDHVARHLAGRADPQRRVLCRRGFGAAPRGAVPDLAASTRPRAWRRSTGSPRSRWTTAAAGRRATGTVASRWTSLRTTSTAGTTAGWTCRPCCAARRRSSSTR